MTKIKTLKMNKAVKRKQFNLMSRREINRQEIKDTLLLNKFIQITNTFRIKEPICFS